ncbi:diguanylate cyclase [Teredinibacter sp. KSP-S5-2]|uniref:sensor domain-containing diguanylate cyclase n=1 Tax=Teredinibacter sp. KSP-S5-2 TaxID=3034506 RepID=UPI002934F5A1|nr:diguanylate cyclase [Teredinibacter sp. KSP-S5-2]WNO11511.1 diguanylate cyclase [Teredinibacter sp. KSP-S5-2]
MQIDALLLSVLDNIPDGFAVFDDKNRLLYCNQAMADFFYTPKDLSQGVSYRKLMLNAYGNGRGKNLGEAEFEQWLTHVEERVNLNIDKSLIVDIHDHKWLKISQQLVGELLVVRGSDISELKKAKIQLIQALEDIEHLNDLDELTGIPNSYSFERTARAEMARCKRYGRAMSLVLLNIDKMKTLNRENGFLVGDEMLQFFSRKVREQLRHTDFLARLGNDEFGMILPESSSSDAFCLAERCRKKIKHYAVLPKALEYTVSITISAGITEIKTTDIDVNDLYIRAKEGLKMSKGRGRNTCTIVD